MSKNKHEMPFFYTNTAQAAIYLIASLVVSPLTVQAQSSPETTLGNVMVTATRSEKAVDLIPGAVQTITREDIARQLSISSDLSQLLDTYIPGFSGGRQKLTSQGETFRGRNPIFLLDGIPISNPLRQGNRETHFVDPLLIEQIEVVSGASAVQGLGATGGIINFITRQARKDATTHSVSVGGSSQFKSDSTSSKAAYTLLYKSGDLDVLAHVSREGRGMGYDGQGRLVGMDVVQGDSQDSGTTSLFVKGGFKFGAGKQQRIQLSLNSFDLQGEGNYRAQTGNRAAGLTTTSVAGAPLGNQSAPKTKVTTASVDYTHGDLAGGLLTAQLFSEKFAARYGSTLTGEFQVTQAIGNGPPAAWLYDQSQINANKTGAKLAWVRPDLGTPGLELTLGLDWLQDRSNQRIVNLDKAWAPNVKLTETAPFAQLEYTSGAYTVRGGVRNERLSLNVPTFNTLPFYGAPLVGGGTISSSKTVLNLGGIYRFTEQFSGFVAYSEGLGFADVGRMLRQVRVPGQTVSSLVDLDPVFTKNKEVGLTWRGAGNWGGSSASVSYYQSNSARGGTIRNDAVTGVAFVDRNPVKITGWQLQGQLRPSRELRLSASVATTKGRTAGDSSNATLNGGPLNFDLPARSQGPNKITLQADYDVSPQLRLGLSTLTLQSRTARIGSAVTAVEQFDGYTLLDFSGQYKASFGSFAFGIENLLNKQYVGYFSQANFTAATTAGQTTARNNGYYAGVGRRYSVSFKRDF
jgi:iron complex outermembrane recepter protein